MGVWFLCSERVGLAGDEGSHVWEIPGQVQGHLGKRSFSTSFTLRFIYKKSSAKIHLIGI